METVLGLSMTSASVGWVLVDGRDADGATLDHDAFDVGVDDTADSTSQHLAAVRGAHAIATASGHQALSIGVTWSDDVEKDARLLLESLKDMGFDKVVGVQLSQATRAWAQGIGRDPGYEKSAVCIVEPATVTVLSVDTADGAVQTDVTQARESASAKGLSQWLTTVFRRDRQPESLLLVGSHGDVDELAAALDEALPMPVLASAEAQLVLARGAALTLAKTPGAVRTGNDNSGNVGAWTRSRGRMFALSAAAVVAAAIALVGLGSLLAADKDSKSAEIPAATNASVTSATTGPLPATVPQAPPPLRTLAAEPPQAPVPPAAPPETVAIAEPQVDAAEAQPASPSTVAPVAALHEQIAAPPAAAPQPQTAPQPVAASQPAIAPAPVAPPQQQPAAPPQVDPAAPPPPPPDPIAVVLSPLFGALP